MGSLYHTEVLEFPGVKLHTKRCLPECINYVNIQYHNYYSIEVVHADYYICIFVTVHGGGGGLI